ncbi:deoxynucleoside kinase [Macrococcus equipercicus]|uniref:Deoxynucleoside kinase n=1 Tax=Macrococcus equipercicus TaxID=69967 RepID=A0A9Q9BNB4_9STAP|nr:deoxynucleoside kinase [Macrococcus equipercicus]KAA1039375.1 deoxynucleoside kinase [Macrococcus equipercicus]UTH13665.1 deoxynucleoside kinase [Macrococcus equipercicus]
MYKIPSDAVITIAGTVGVGKSSLTKALAEKLNFRTSFEKVDNNPYLEKFYHDFDRWSFHLQIYFLAERFKEQKRMFEYGGGFIQDRSIYEDVDIFAKMHEEGGTMTAEDFETYRQLYEAMVMTPYFPKPDCLIYLECDYDAVLRRITERGRQMEIETDELYWRALFARYEQWIDSFNACPVIRIHIDEYDVFDNIDTLDPVIEKIGRVIEEHRKSQQR